MSIRRYLVCFYANFSWGRKKEKKKRKKERKKEKKRKERNLFTPIKRYNKSTCY